MSSDQTGSPYVSKSYLYTITIDRFASPSLSGLLSLDNVEKNINVVLNRTDTITFKLVPKNFMGTAKLVMGCITSAKPILGAELMQGDQMFQGEFAPSWAFDVDTLSSGPLICNGPGKWRLTGAFIFADENGQYSYALPDPEPTVGTGK